MEIVHLHFPSLESTNDWGKKHLASLDRKSITLVTVDAQTSGRGRFGRKWMMYPRLSLCGSFCFFLPIEQKDLMYLAQIMALSLVDVLQKRGIKPQIKWPNDVFVNQKKIAGILCEISSFPDCLGVVLGVGLNVNVPLELLQNIEQPATSLFNETGKKEPLPEIWKDLEKIFKESLMQFIREGFTRWMPQFQSLLIQKL